MKMYFPNVMILFCRRTSHSGGFVLLSLMPDSVCLFLRKHL